MKHKQVLSLITAASFLLNASGSSVAFDLFGDEAIQRNRERLAIQSAEIAQQRAEIEALKQEQPMEASRDDSETYRRPFQPTEADQNLSEEEDQADEASLSWGQLTLLGLGALALLAVLSDSSGGESAYTDSGSSYGGSSSGAWSDGEENDPWDDVPEDGSIGCSWGDKNYGTCH